MVGYVSDDDSDFAVFRIIDFQKIIIITTGLIAVCTFAGNIQTANFRVFMRQKILLNLLGQGERLPHTPVFLVQSGHGVIPPSNEKPEKKKNNGGHAGDIHQKRDDDGSRG